MKRRDRRKNHFRLIISVHKGLSPGRVGTSASAAKICLVASATFTRVSNLPGIYFITSGGGNGNPLQDSCLENPMDKEPGGL